MDNGVLSCADPKRLQVLSDGLSAEKIEARLRKWLRLLPHPFAAKDRQAGYRYQLSILQMALSLTQGLDRPVSGRIFCEEVIRENLDIGCPKQPGLVSNVCRRSRWYSARVKLAATMVSTSSATRSRSMAGITAYNSSSPSPVYVRLPLDSALATAPLARAAGIARQVGRASMGECADTPARWVATRAASRMRADRQTEAHPGQRAYRRPGKPEDIGDVLHLDVADAGHELQGLVELARAIIRPCDVVGEAPTGQL